MINKSINIKYQISIFFKKKNNLKEKIFKKKRKKYFDKKENRFKERFNMFFFLYWYCSFL